MDPAPIHPARSLAAAHAHAFLAELLARGEPPAVDTAACADGGQTVLVMRYPTPAGGQPALGPCDLDCLRLLAAGGRLTAERLRDELEARRFGIHSIATVKRSLKRLRDLGLVCSSRHSPRGYHLADGTRPGRAG
ncbi:MAG: hypothetical protein U0736_20725 [Gemmataceae bacterium]